jgi:hypothetical protein
MYYIKFNEDGFQQQIALSDEDPGDGWHQLDEDVDGKLFILDSGAVRALTETEHEAKMNQMLTDNTMFFLRLQRDALLAESDWTQLDSSPLTAEKKAEWETYRQALRNLPSTIGEDLTYELPAPPA